MRRSLIMLSALGMLSAALGCHVAGVCDCDHHVPCCVGGDHFAGHGDVITPVAASSSEIIHETPRPAAGVLPMAR